MVNIENGYFNLQETLETFKRKVLLKRVFVNLDELYLIRIYISDVYSDEIDLDLEFHFEILRLRYHVTLIR